MKPRSQKIRCAEKGSALLAALCFCAVLGIGLASYVGVCYQTLQTSSRNNHGTYSFELAEVGMEEALGALNRWNYDPSSYNWSDWTLNNAVSPKTATKTITGFSFGNGATGVVAITVANYDGAEAGGATITATGTSTLSEGFTVSRTLKAVAKAAPLFVNALAATSTSKGTSAGIRFANGGTVDSIDSSSATPSVIGYSAVVSSGGRITLTDAQIQGYAAAATDANTLLLSYTWSARVCGPSTPMSAQIDETRLSSSPYQPVFDIKTLTDGESLPALALPPTSTTIGTSGTSKTYNTDDLELTSERLVIAGDVTIRVSGDFSITDSAQIIVPTGSSLQIVITGEHSTLMIGGNGIDNQSGKARNVAIFYNATSPHDVATGTSNPKIATNQDFFGVIYAPNCNVDFVVSSSSSEFDFTGSLVAKTIYIESASPKFHYDLDLRNVTQFSALDTPFVISSWQEITSTP